METLTYEERIKKLNEIIQDSKQICFFGGAGVSTESGIPDFRSKDGLYNNVDEEFSKYDPEYLLSHACLYNHPKMFYSFYRKKLDIRGIEPNKAHYKLAELEEKGKISGIVTQNVDGLHQKAGSKKVYELHGSFLRVYCAGCKKEYPNDYLFTNTDSIVKCPVCRHLIRPDVVLYDEMLPTKAINGGAKAIYNADCLIIAGTSLKVEPAASMVKGYFGKYIVIINRDPLGDIEQYADVVFRENVGEVLDRIIV